MSYKQIVHELGGATVVADWISERAPTKLDRESVYKWYRGAVPWKWRPLLIKMAAEKNVRLPDELTAGMAA